MAVRTGVVVAVSTLSLLASAAGAQTQSTALPASATTRPSLVFSTYLGGSGRAQTIPLAVAVDDRRYIYVTGRTEARDFPSVNPAQPNFGGGGNDAFVIKLTPDGQQIVYATFLGGGDREWGERLAVDAGGNAYVAGTTYSRNFPTTSRAAQQKFGGGDRDAFVAKIGPNGVLVYSTLLGGNGADRATGIAIDHEGAAYIAGSTSSKRFAVRATGPASSESSGSDDWDVLLAKLDARGAALEYAVRFGGTGGFEPPRGGMGDESATGIAVDHRGSVWVSGYTNRSDFPVLNGSPSTAGTESDGFVARLDALTGALRTSTFLGGSPIRTAAVALDQSGSIYVAGTTEDDVIVVKLNADLNAVAYRTRIRAPGSDSVRDLAVDAIGRAYIAGVTRSQHFPTVDPLQAGTDLSEERLRARASLGDALVAALDTNGTTLLFATRLGGSLTDQAGGIALDPSGAVIIAGDTSYGDFAGFPVLRALQSERRNSTTQGFVAKIAIPLAER